MRIGGFMSSYLRPESDSPDSIPVFFGQIGNGSGLVNVNLADDKAILIVIDDDQDD